MLAALRTGGTSEHPGSGCVRAAARARGGRQPRALGTVKRLGDEFVSSGAWIEVMLNDGKSAADHLRLLEGEWDEMEILGY